MGYTTIYNKFLPYFQERYLFQRCPVDREGDLAVFIDTYWKKDHILARSPDFLKWQHYDNTDNLYNFVIATYKPTCEIHAIFGYTLSSHFDNNINEPILWGNIWKNREDINEPGLGMMVCWLTYEIYSNVGRSGLGLSKAAMRQARGYVKIGLSDQYYILHPHKTVFKIASNVHEVDRYNPKAIIADKILVSCPENLYNEKIDPIIKTIPRHKSKKYYINRFYNHPIYSYHAYGIKDINDDIIGVLFCRFCEFENARCLRIVDYFGIDGALIGCLKAFLNLLKESDAEYIDFICVNMPAIEMELAGFINRRNKIDIIIPNYFEPFIQDNIDIYYSIDRYHPPYDQRIFKADSDQDRPS